MYAAGEPILENAEPMSTPPLSVTHLRQQYASRGLREEDLAPDPYQQFDRWLREALAAELYEPYAMTLATATPDGKPSVRTVLLRGSDERGFVFYTNYESRKGEELAANPHAALLFFWAELERQVRIEGRVEKVSPEESDAYFQGRPRESCLGAWASAQSRVIADRGVLERRMRELEEEFTGRSVPRPQYWGGYRVVPSVLEFWQGGAHRLHDRLCYFREEKGGWVIRRLSP
jgi:pyridoxamine 5'-phosphate oxidase